MAQIAQRRDELSTTSATRRYLWLMVALIGAAFVLRVYRLDTVPLRGDEAFAIEHWAATPSRVARDLAETEPHPFGTFFGFYAWKRLAGDSEFAMRYLPLLGNLLGVAAVAALGRRLFHRRGVALLAAALWALNAFQIWHAQDARNYAIWAGLSPLAMWLFLRAADTNRPRDWVWYVLAECLALYVFFLEGMLLVVQAAHLLIYRRSGPVVRRAVIAWVILGLLLIPWFVQLWYLSGSGYEGNTARADSARLLTWFLPVLLTGDTLPGPWDVIIPLGWLGLVAALLFMRRRPDRVTGWLAVWIALPTILLLVAATNISIFHPRYLIALAPALLLLFARALLPPADQGSTVRLATVAPLLIVPLLGVGTLADYYWGSDTKSPDWPAVTVYLEARARPAQRVVKIAVDPAFNYYYDGPAEETTLLPDAPIPAQLRPEITFGDTIWLVGDSPEAEAYLDERLQFLSRDKVANFTISQYRQHDISPGEIETPANVTFGTAARLVGYTLQGPDAHTPALTLLLYWEPLAQTELDYKVFVHLTPWDQETTVLDQDDHRPLVGFASTQIWEPGTLLRDPYRLLVGADAPPPGAYTLRVGFYDPDTGNRLPTFDADGAPLDDSVPLATVRWPLK